MTEQTPNSKLTYVEHARKALQCGIDASPGADEHRHFAQAQVLATLAIVDTLDALSNDLAAIANMMTDFLQEREAEANRQELLHRHMGAGPAKS